MKNTHHEPKIETVKETSSRPTRDARNTSTNEAAAATAREMFTVANFILPRVLRLKDAPRYLGMDRNRFNAEVRPHVTEVPIGRQGIGFDRLDLDTWFDEHKQRNGRPKQLEGEKSWAVKQHQDSVNAGKSGISKRRSVEYDFTKALEKVVSKKPKSCSQKG